MNPRIIKEVRLLFWPWCLMLAAALMPVAGDALRHFHELSIFLWGFGLFAGIPFLAAFSLGGEFQQRTLPLLLGLPVQRTKIWAEKQLVLLPALLLAGMIFLLTRPAENELNGEVVAIFSAWLLATLCSTTFWTLLARSTIGGVMLGQVAHFLLGAALVNLGLRIFGEEPSPKMLHVAEAFGVAICLVYSALMLWLGRRMLVRFQATGGVTGTDLLMAGPRVLPVALADLLRCRATSPTLNLVRKEFRLLRPLWFIMLLFLVCWVCVVVTVRVMPQTEEWREWREVMPGLALAFYVPLAIVLAGCLSLGEERLSGTHQWHLTLPVSIRRQWFIKLVMALGAGVFSGMVVPVFAVLTGQLLLHSPFGTEFTWHFGPSDIPGSIIPVALAICASFPAFWCASTVNGAVRAALWMLPVMALLSLAGAGGVWLAGEFRGTSGVVMTAIMAHWQLSPARIMEVYSHAMNRDLWAIWVIFPTVLCAVFQSRRLFQTQPQDGILPVLRRLVPLSLVTFLCGLIFAVVMNAAEQAYNVPICQEAYDALKKLSINSRELDAAHPLKVSVDELAKAAPLSEATRQWLRGSTIAMVPGKGKGARVATIRFTDGSEFPMNFRVGE